MESWKKRWLSEIDEKLPTMSEEVKNTPIYAENNSKQGFSLRAWIHENKKRFTAALATCTAAVVTLSIILPIALQRTPGTGVPVEKAPSVLCLEINPKAVFSVDKEGVVTGVVAMNQDADVILADETRINRMEGETAEQAMETFVDYAAKLGYLNLNTQTAIRVSEYNNENASVRAEAVRQKLEAYFVAKGSKILVVQDTLDGNAFCQRAGLENSPDGVAGVAQRVDTMHALFGQREAESTSPDELETLYQQWLPMEEIQLWITLGEFIGIDMSFLKELLDLPKDLIEYQMKMQGYLSEKYNRLQDEAEQDYNAMRDLLTAEDYVAHREQILQEYGSWENYWASL